MKIHPTTDCYPMMDDEEMAALVADVKANGLLYPITVFKGVLLDGRNRIEACKQAGVKVRETEYDGDDPEAFIISTNKRRNLTVAQRAMVAARMANLSKGNLSKSAKLPISPITQPEAAAAQNVSERSVRTAKAILEADPELAEKVAQGEVTLESAVKEVKIMAAKRRMANRKKEAKKSSAEKYVLHHGDFTVSPIEPESVDAIITDPPYPKEFLDLYRKLFDYASIILKPGGRLAVMCGQSHLPDIMAMLLNRKDDISYQWTLAYLTPGTSAQIFSRHIKSNWKPVVFCVKGKNTWEHVEDTVKSEKSDKRFHEWGQSVGGMAMLIERFTVEQEVVFDPFVGGGTTAVAAVKTNRRFIGSDIDSECISKTKERLESE